MSSSEPRGKRRSDASGGAAARLFLALDLPQDARSAIARWRDTVIDGHRELRPVAAEALHVTLIFLGRRPLEQLSEIRQVATATALGLRAPTLVPTELVPLPPRRPRLLALDLGDEGGRAAALHGALSGALEAAGLHEPEARAFWPHVTLARVRGRSRLGALDPSPPPPRSRFRVSLLTLYRSDLRRAGARYLALECLELAQPCG